MHTQCLEILLVVTDFILSLSAQSLHFCSRGTSNMRQSCMLRPELVAIPATALPLHISKLDVYAACAAQQLIHILRPMHPSTSCMHRQHHCKQP